MTFKVVETFPGSHTLYDPKGNKVANIEEVEHVPHWEKQGIKTKKKNEANRLTTYKITNLAGITDKSAFSLRAAVTHAINHYSDGKHLSHPDSTKLIGEHINKLGEAIHTASMDPRIKSDKDHEKLLEISQAHAHLKQLHQKHFGNK